ncbi:hypothetical protein LOTGIDRAFT_228808 [Lottia gigantea]|uniref:EamA domain-containing protein n=1 Tax=Lottia gigantea TaxID=225164 RepID=V3ZJC2_LOTGI|nr:hypothetical protein LOTGIDRAFT_228808 [Lottia gigantea]ESO91358.1 hypothetical protein LOTGIDRAFT_228808 [Lottia gigantea]
MDGDGQQPIPGINNRPRNPCYIICYGFVLFVFGTLTALGDHWGKHLKVRGSTGRNGVGDDSDGLPKKHTFDHDFFMAPILFAGQILCLIIYWILNRFEVGRVLFPPRVTPRQRNRQLHRETKFNVYIFILPALFRYVATCLLYVGVRLTYSSSTILFKGSLVHLQVKHLLAYLWILGRRLINGTILFFTSLLSVAFLGRNMNPRMWVGVVISIAGLAVLGINDYIYQIKDEYDTNGIVAGDLLIVMAQIMFATQAVWEQRILTKYPNMSPLQCLGYEGLWGFCISFILAIPFSFVNAGAFSELPGHYLENPSDAFKQMKNSGVIVAIVVVVLLSNTIHYWFALIITKNYGATQRMMIDSIGFGVTWGVALLLKWEKFDIYIIPGFFLIGLGYILFFDIILYPIWKCLYRAICSPTPGEDDASPLIHPNGNIAGIQ